MKAMNTARIAALAALALSASASAEVISVAPRDTAGLVAAIEHANRSPGEDIIELAAGSLYAVDTAAEPGRSLALPTIRSRIRILGNGAEIRRYTDQPLRLVAVAPAGSLRLEHLVLAEGARGAVENRGRLELARVRIIDNTAAGSEAIVENYGTLVARDSEISWNEIAGAQRDAGIVLNYGSLDFTDSTLRENRVARRYGTLVTASAILNYGEARLAHVRVASNVAAEGLADDDAHREGRAALVSLGNGRFVTERIVLDANWPADQLAGD